MKKYLRVIILFMLPILLYYLPFVCAGYLTYEFADADKCIELQREDPTSLCGLGYSDQTAYYKLTNADYYRAPVIALGTSRVMQFKSAYFSSDFYNCGGAVSGNYNGYRNFLENLSYSPEVVLVGIDSWVFNDAWNQQITDPDEFTLIQKPDPDIYSLSVRLRKDWITKWHFRDLYKYPNNTGFNGRIKDDGFMTDGSRYYGYTYRYPELQDDYGFVDTLDRIQTGTRRFEWGDHIDDDTLYQLNNLLEYCYENNIDVIGFMPPFAPRINEAMENSGRYAYLDEIAPGCAEIFDKYDYEFYDYSDVSRLSITDDYYLDGFHGSEIVYARIVEDMCNTGSCISKYIDENALTDLLDNAYDGKTFYDPDNRFD